MKTLAATAPADTAPALGWFRLPRWRRSETVAAEPDPMALVYRQHMMLAGYRGIGELLAAQVPCPMTYMEIADLASDRVPDHPIYGEWVRSYSSKLNPELAAHRPWWAQTLDRLADESSPAQRARMRTNFVRSCKYEWMFWDMAYKMAGWPV